MKKWVLILIAVLFFVALVPTIASGIASLNGNENISAGAYALLGLVVLILVGGFIFTVYKAAFGGGKGGM